MANWIDICSADDCPLGECREFVAGGRMVALFHTDQGLRALDGICPHQGGPLGKGSLLGCIVTCPWHGWQFDVTTGVHQTSPIIQPTLPVRVENGQVQVDITADPNLQ